MQCKYAVFIEPEPELATYLRALKTEIERWRPRQKYCDHPPHCTLLVGAYSDPQNWVDELTTTLTQSPFSIHINNWLVFHNDPQANGGQTVTLAIESLPELFSLQLSCAEVLKRHIVPGSIEYQELPEPLAASFQVYGFPFVGSHWLPHFSVASLSVSTDDPFLLTMIARPVDFFNAVNALSVWRVQGNDHQRICRINLPGQ